MTTPQGNVELQCRLDLNLKRRCRSFIAGLKPGEEVVITQNARPVAKMSAAEIFPPPQFGNCKGQLMILVVDDEHLNDFQNLMS
jgi:antitoxin (DNA-binding transcriptional repressor) of toxin-antitoxin stability system